MLDDNEQALVKTMHLLTTKPTMYIANVAEDGFENNPHLDAVSEYAASDGAGVVAICNKLESEISELEDDEKLEFLTYMGMESRARSNDPRGLHVAKSSDLLHRRSKGSACLDN